MYSKRKRITFGDIVLILIGLGIIAGIVFLVLTPFVKNTKYRQTEGKLREARDSIIAFVMKERRLPTSAEFSTISMNIDAWGGTIIYVPDQSFTAAGTFCCASPSGIVLKEKGEAIPDIAFVIISEGKNRLNDTGTGLRFQVRERNEGYDDIVAFEKIADLLKLAGCTSLGIENESLPIAVEDGYYSTKLIVNSECSDQAKASYTWNVVKGALPKGIVLGKDGSLIGTVDISDTQKGTLNVCTADYPVTIKVSGAGGVPAEKEFELKVIPWRLRILRQEIPTVYASEEYTFTPQWRGGRSDYTWKVSGGNLPPGLILGEKRGTISGKPETGMAGQYTFTLSLNDGCTEVTREFTMSTGACSPLHIRPEPPLTVSVGEPFSQTLIVEGGRPPYMTVVDRCVNNCADMNIDLKCQDSNAVLSGTPEAIGSCTFSVEWLDSCPAGTQAVKGDYILHVKEKVPGSSQDEPAKDQ